MSSNAAPLPQGKPGGEPSMEEILASIRRIIADDSVGTKRDEAYIAPPPPPAAPAPVAAQPAPPPPAPPMEEPDADVLDLADVAIVKQEVDDLALVGMEEEELEDDLLGTPVDVDPALNATPALVSPLSAIKAPLNTVPAMTDHILSRETGGLVANAFAQLQRSTPLPAAGRTLEDLVSEMLRPMLADWMDSHLPSIVERLVKAEIERVSRGG